MKKNYILGNGEALTSRIIKKRASRPPTPVYSFEETLERLSPQLDTLLVTIDQAKPETIPYGVDVAKITLHPKYIARSYFPKRILRECNLESVGSRSKEIIPEKLHNKRDKNITTTEIFVSGNIEDFKNLNKLLSFSNNEDKLIDELNRIENIEHYSIEDKLIGINTEDLENQKKSAFEIGLHLVPQIPTEEIISKFTKYCEKYEIIIKTDLAIEIGKIIFFPIKTNIKTLLQIAKFSLVRLIRPMPTLRKLSDTLRTENDIIDRVSINEKPPLSLEPKVAILDGGLPDSNPIKHWTNNYIESDPLADSIDEGIAHGLAVTGAFLFGPIDTSTTLHQPYSYVDHHRILDADEDQDDFELYRTLNHIEDILVSKIYSFINLSLGPHYPIEDNEIHPWTALIDKKLKDGETFMTIAIGNNGKYDEELGLNRLQVPGDCVNAITVGACDHQIDWAKADYSPIGPGRSPGLVKPDLVSFGGKCFSLLLFHP